MVTERHSAASPRVNWRVYAHRRAYAGLWMGPGSLCLCVVVGAPFMGLAPGSARIWGLIGGLFIMFGHFFSLVEVVAILGRRDVAEQMPFRFRLLIAYWVVVLAVVAFAGIM